MHERANPEYEGAITALVTPFTEGGERVDLNALERHVYFQVDNGVDGLVACGTTGEATTLEDKEYETVIRAVVEQAAGAVPVIAGAGDSSTRRAIELSRLAEQSGADALLHVTPPYNKPNPDGLLAHYQAIAESTPLPIILYNVPGRTGTNLRSPEVVRIAKSVPQVVGIKEASGNLEQMREIKEALPEFTVLSGEDALTLSGMELGAAGCVAVVSNEVPREFSDLTSAASEGRWSDAAALHDEWVDLMGVNFIEGNPIPVKAALAEMGRIEESYRLPLTNMRPENRAVLLRILREHGLI